MPEAIQDQEPRRDPELDLIVNNRDQLESMLGDANTLIPSGGAPNDEIFQKRAVMEEASTGTGEPIAPTEIPRPGDRPTGASVTPAETALHQSQVQARQAYEAQRNSYLNTESPDYQRRVAFEKQRLINRTRAIQDIVPILLRRIDQRIKSLDGLPDAERRNRMEEILNFQRIDREVAIRDRVTEIENGTQIGESATISYFNEEIRDFSRGEETRSRTAETVRKRNKANFLRGGMNDLMREAAAQRVSERQGRGSVDEVFQKVANDAWMEMTALDIEYVTRDLRGEAKNQAIYQQTVDTLLQKKMTENRLERASLRNQSRLRRLWNSVRSLVRAPGRLISRTWGARREMRGGELTHGPIERVRRSIELIENDMALTGRIRRLGDYRNKLRRAYNYSFLSLVQTITDEQEITPRQLLEKGLNLSEQQEEQ